MVPMSLFREVSISLVVLVSGAANAGSYASCLLDKLPGAVNDVVAHANIQICIANHPGGFATDKQGSGRGLFGFNSGAECTVKKASDTRSNRAASMISVACKKLYDEPNPFD